MNFYSKMNPEITWTKKKNCYMMLGNVNWCCISTTKRIYYCECSILSRATLCGRERCSSSRPIFSILVHCLTSTSLEQYLISWVLEQCLISGTLEQQWLSTGHKSVTVSICRNSTILEHYHQWIYMYMCPYNSSMSIANIQYFHNQRRWRIAVKQIQLGSTNVSDVNQGWML